MPNQTSFTEAFANLAQLCDQVVADRDVVIITRQDGESVALIAADELDSLMETAYLLRSPTNAARLLTALQRAKTRTLEPQSISALRQEIGLGEEG
ncbi:type II toxin-antitoxin system Phd/YefM family antitoxin [Allocoleopsis franciscana]|uniref:Antitoxin n=1 Tax=Allocoleopsis franciscana PCC 7113 TaxID=1173027 RepID=K9WKQ9_9CYAN|nr:type II toxin-antitoxin system prevent-host-death family antitoxin [Allocoleopsis franciscana]AFZ20369.1 prevent-host-death family protein [Allocoleopsis franciscana PCC 7113]